VDQSISPEIPVSEIRDYFCCPYIWWFRGAPLGLEQQEQLLRAKSDPSMKRTRTMPFEIPRTALALLLAIAWAVAGIVSWITGNLFKNEPTVGPEVYTLHYLGLAMMGFSIYRMVRWFRWVQRTPAFDRALPGEPLFDSANENEPRIFHAPRYGITGTLHTVVKLDDKLITSETRSVETPKTFTDQDRMQAVAEALLAEAEFGQLPEYAYIVYPDRTFEVRMVPAEIQRLQDALQKMRTATETGQMPDALPSWYLCPACPIPTCPKRIGEVPPIAPFIPR